VSGNARSALRPLYEATRYLVHHAGRTLDARIGETSPALDALLAAENATVGTFITAANPRSEQRSQAENEAANRALAIELRQAGYRWHTHKGVAIDGFWRENGFFVLGLQGEDALRWAERFGQYAVIEATLGRAPAVRFGRLADVKA
jgi:hypothetical protein